MTNTASFPICPSEAVLLGRVLEEFLQLKKHSPENIYFVDFVISRICPFWPNVATRWVAASADTPGAQIGDNGEYGLKIECRGDRKMFPDLLVDALSGSIAISLSERRLFSLDDSIDFDAPGRQLKKESSGLPLDDATSNPEAWDKFREAMRNFQDALFKRYGADDPKAILDVACSLARESDCSDFLELGRRLGRGFAACTQFELLIRGDGSPGEWHKDVYEQYGLTPEHNFVGNFVERVHELTEALLKSAVLNEDCFSSLMLRDLLQGRLGGPLPNWEDDLYEAIQAAGEARMAFASAMGEVLGRLYGRDKAAWEKDANSRSPRLWKLSSHATSERVGGEIITVQDVLSSPHRAMMPPESILRMLIICIEPLCKEVWPKDLENQSEAGCAKVLDDKCYNSSGIENKFAQLARHLYRTYRNAAVHGDRNFTSNWREVNHVLSAMQFLYSMHKELMKGRS